MLSEYMFYLCIHLITYQLSEHRLCLCIHRIAYCPSIYYTRAFTGLLTNRVLLKNPSLFNSIQVRSVNLTHQSVTSDDIYIYIYVCVCVRARVCVRMRVRARACVCVRARAHAHACACGPKTVSIKTILLESKSNYYKEKKRSK